jgi:hypothetical protein
VRQQRFDQVGPDEPSAAGDQISFHALLRKVEGGSKRY